MSFARYPAYKDSGVEWLGEVPEHWNVIEARREIAFLTSGSRGWAEYYSEEGPVFLRIGNLTRDSIHIDLEDIQRVNPPPGVEGDRTQVSSGDVLFSITAYLGSVAVVPQGLEKAYVSQHVCLARLTGRRLLPEWLAYSVLSSTGKAYLESESYGGTKVQLSLDDIKSFPLPLPSLDEQRALTSLLDRETAKIDALIAEQQRLIELLQEKRQAVISHAVTKGLNPDAPMKDSGVEWLGEVPEHWTVSAVGHRYEVRLGKMLDEKRVTGEHLGPYLRNTDVQWESINIEELSEMDFEPSEYDRYSLREGDLLVCEGGEVGRSAIWQSQLSFCFYQKALHRLRPYNQGSDDCRFQLYVMRMACSMGVFEASSGKATINHLPAESFRRYRFAYPPLDEQIAIAEHLSQVCCQMNELEAEAQSLVSTLQERRSALISAAVTGQIDVWGLVPEASAA